MTAPNPLVAERVDSTTAITGIGIAESAVDVYNGISSGSWVEGGLGLAGGGLETLGLIVDPVGTLVSYGVAWLMEHVQPLSDALDWLAGDPDTISSYAQTWRNVSAAVATARTDFDAAVQSDTAAWTGAAGNAYRTYTRGQSEQFGAAATAADTVGTVVELVGVLVGVVREIVRDLVADCVATLIARIPQWLAEIAGTFGLATPHVIASAVALISKWVARISDVIRKLVRSVEALRPLLRRLDEIWATIRQGVRSLPGHASGPNGTSSRTFAPRDVTDPATVDTPTVDGTTAGTTGGTTTSGSTPVTGTPTVGTDTPAATTSQSTTAPGSVADVPATSGPGTPSTTATTSGTGGNPTATPTVAAAPSTPTTPATTSGTTSTGPGTGGVGPNARPATTPRLSDDDFARLSTDEQLRVAQSEVDQGAHTFADNDEAQRYGADYWNDYADNLPPEQRQALFDYTTDPPHYPSYREINSYLRGQDAGSPQVQHAVDQIDQALAGRPLPEDVVVSRGTGLSHIGMPPQDMVGQTFTEQAYLSTSLGGPADAFASKEAILHMKVPAGTPGIWVENVGAYGAGERELLLGRGLEYRVDRVVFQGGQWHVYGEYLPVR